ncbi:gamma-glutamyltransferase family protein [Pandoraea sp.]|uniref:gamma-glutamyltransferase family protein n=1 Tax=Pandoraea sp. TaxID=1883445 RepID=UPI001224F70E|nr:gamma-glutamyltransferase family protein [Pandoraea sp.]TAL57209.1 MAG: gamma-glutamyltransferase family protein [Pandoraea sp.]TAM16543.1 MAG: gamma-glutamyltransferase family protein [Pandoraea sp.]
MQFTTRPELIGTFGMVASTHWLASSVGMAVLEKGGNAFDAAAAAGFVLQIVEPHLNGPGGELPVVFYSAAQDRVRVLCAQGVTPAAMTIERMHALGLEVVPGTGLLPAVVPGAFGGWMALLRDYGQLPLAEVLGYAIDYAENGYPVLPRVASSILAAETFFQNEWPTSAEVWLRDGKAPAPHTLMRNPGIAATYRRLLAEAGAVSDRAEQCERARLAFYQGFVAEAIDTFFRTTAVLDTSGRRNAGLLAADDLARWAPTYEEPASYEYAGLRVHKTGPWGQGPVFLQQLALLKRFDLAAMDPAGPEFVHTVVECAKLAFADRDIFYGDPDFCEVPLQTLLGDAYNDARSRLVDARHASRELRPGQLGDSDARLATILANAGRAQTGGFGQGEPTFAPLPELKGDTVHLDVVDRWGNMVSATPSGGWLQASPAVPELGFCITTRGQMFWMAPGLPSSLGPGRRPRTTLTPTLVTREGKPYAAFGSPGGDQQDQWSLQMFVKHVHHGMNFQLAIDAPTFQTAHFPASFYPRAMQLGHLAIEGRYSPATLAALRERGHDLQVMDDWALGRLCAVGVRGGLLRAAATPRLMQAYAVGR